MLTKYIILFECTLSFSTACFKLGPYLITHIHPALYIEVKNKMNQIHKFILTKKRTPWIHV